MKKKKREGKEKREGRGGERKGVPRVKKKEKCRAACSTLGCGACAFNPCVLQAARHFSFFLRARAGPRQTLKIWVQKMRLDHTIHPQ